MDFITIQNFGIFQRTPKEKKTSQKRQAINWEEIFVKRKSDKGIVFRTNKELLQHD